jgi:putative ABC transport system permease protein
MDTLLQDLRYALRQLARSPGFTLVAVLTLALGIGAAVALFSAVDTLLLRPLPLHRPERLVEVAPEMEGPIQIPRFAYPQYTGLRERTRELSGLAAATNYEFSLRGDGQAAEVVPGEFVSANYFSVLGVRPALGRFFLPGEDPPGEARSAVLSYPLWRQRFGGDPTVLGRTVSLNGETLTVVGVAPRGFATNRIGSTPPAVWLPMGAYTAFESAQALEGGQYMLALIGRLREGATEATATAELSTHLRRISEEAKFGIAGIRMERVRLRPLDPIAPQFGERVTGYLALLAAATGLVLLLASVNVAGMLLARALTRRTEIGVRMAVGARRRRVARQLLTEGALLFVLGGGAGVLLAIWLTTALSAVPWPVPVQLDLAIDGRVLAFALLLALATGLGFGLVPALQATGAGVLPMLRVGSGSVGPSRSRLRGTLVVLQIALSILLLVGAGLFLRALQRAWSIDPGFDPDGVMVATLDLSLHGYEGTASERFLQQLLERARAVPGVEAASLATSTPFGARAGGLAITPEGVELPPGPPFIFASFNFIAPEYFRTLHIPLLHGRALDEGHGRGERVAVINRAMAETFWPGQDAIGKILDGGENPLRVVGVVGDVRAEALDAEPQPMMYLPLFGGDSHGAMEVVLHLRTGSNPAAALAALRAEVRSMDPSLPPLAFSPLNELIGMSLLPQRIGALLVGGFGLFGLLLVALGLYGVLAYSAARRTREVGLRIALGARRGEVVRLILREGASITGLGLALGLLAAAAGTRMLSGLLYGVNPLDPATYAAVAALLATVALLAGYLPARRAARVDPTVALRAE